MREATAARRDSEREARRLRRASALTQRKVRSGMQAAVGPTRGARALNDMRAQVDACMGPVPPPAAPVARRLHGMTLVARCQSRNTVLSLSKGG